MSSEHIFDTPPGEADYEASRLSIRGEDHHRGPGSGNVTYEQ